MGSTVSEGAKEGATVCEGCCGVGYCVRATVWGGSCEDYGVVRMKKCEGVYCVIRGVVQVLGLCRP